jgi:hypothetical protein
MAQERDRPFSSLVPSDFETLRHILISFVGHGDRRHPRPPRTFLKAVPKSIELLGGASSQGLDRPIGTIPNPAINAETFGLAPHEVSKSNALDPTHDSKSFDAHWLTVFNKRSPLQDSGKFSTAFASRWACFP